VIPFISWLKYPTDITARDAMGSVLMWLKASVVCPSSSFLCKPTQRAYHCWWYSLCVFMQRTEWWMWEEGRDVGLCWRWEQNSPCTMCRGSNFCLWTQYSPLLFHFSRIRPTTEKNSQNQLIINNLMKKSMLYWNPKCYRHFHKIPLMDWQTIWFTVSSSFLKIYIILSSQFTCPNWHSLFH